MAVFSRVYSCVHSGPAVHFDDKANNIGYTSVRVSRVPRLHVSSFSAHETSSDSDEWGRQRQRSEERLRVRLRDRSLRTRSSGEPPREHVQSHPSLLAADARQRPLDLLTTECAAVRSARGHIELHVAAAPATATARRVPAETRPSVGREASFNTCNPISSELRESETCGKQLR